MRRILIGVIGSFGVLVCLMGADGGGDGLVIAGKAGDESGAVDTVTIEFAGGAKFILSRQSQMKQLWLAAGSHGFHYSWDAARGLWLDDKDGHELFPRLAEAISEQLGHPVEF